MNKKPRKQKIKTSLTSFDSTKLEKIRVLFHESILRSILKILTMESDVFRTLKSVKNINRLFTNIDIELYKRERTSKELEAYIWCIRYISEQWLDGVININIIISMARSHEDYDNLRDQLINSCIDDPNIISAREAQGVFDLVSEALQIGYFNAFREEYEEIVKGLDTEDPSDFKQLVNRMFEISQHIMNIKHNTNLVASTLAFNTSDVDSIRESLKLTISSLSGESNIFKMGIKRLNTLLSPGFMNGRVYVFLGLPGSGKSLILLKAALDIRKYNTDFQTKTPGMKPCVLYITMENTFTETIERTWNMSFDESITNVTEEEALERLSQELGIDYVSEDSEEKHSKEIKDLEDLLNKKDDHMNIEIVMQYFSYRSISTDDIFTRIQDLRDENMEVCALVFDYIKRIRPAQAVVDNVKMELNRVINELKAIGVIFDIPVITAHQMNRAAATTVDHATRQGKGDVTKLVGRDSVGDAWEVIETADWAAILNIEYKPGTDDKYMIISVVKRRRIDSNESDFAQFTYLAHPFAKRNGLRLIDDYHLDKVLSLRSLVSDIDVVGKEKVNAVNRDVKLPTSEFVDLEKYDEI